MGNKPDPLSGEEDNENSNGGEIQPTAKPDDEAAKVDEGAENEGDNNGLDVNESSLTFVQIGECVSVPADNDNDDEEEEDVGDGVEEILDDGNDDDEKVEEEEEEESQNSPEWRYDGPAQVVGEDANLETAKEDSVGDVLVPDGAQESPEQNDEGTSAELELALSDSDLQTEEAMDGIQEEGDGQDGQEQEQDAGQADVGQDSDGQLEEDGEGNNVLNDENGDGDVEKEEGACSAEN